MAATKRNACSSIRSKWSAVLVLLMLSAPIHRTEGAEYANEESANEKVAEAASEEIVEDPSSRIGFYSRPYGYDAGPMGANHAFYPVNTDPAAFSGNRFGSMPDTFGGYGAYAANGFASNPVVRIPDPTMAGIGALPPSVFQMNPQMGFGAMAGYGSNAYAGYEAATSSPISADYGGYAVTSAPPVLTMATAAPLPSGYDTYTMSPDPYYAMQPTGYQGNYNGYPASAPPASQGFINQGTRFVDGLSFNSFQNAVPLPFIQNFAPPKPMALMYSTGTGRMSFVPA